MLVAAPFALQKVQYAREIVFRCCVGVRILVRMVSRPMDRSIRRVARHSAVNKRTQCVSVRRGVGSSVRRWRLDSGLVGGLRLNGGVSRGGTWAAVPVLRCCRRALSTGWLRRTLWVDVRRLTWARSIGISLPTPMKRRSSRKWPCLSLETPMPRQLLVTSCRASRDVR